ncbi:MAG TPA: alpha-glucuronidase family glycosyl hydrolase, partial [Clostridiales bacterium]|nr:alpha-glucuronidase family glycosyl hydrolase [Clostridiales bacterium]
MELTGFLSGAKEFISSILAVLIFLSSSFGIVNPPVEPFVPENIVEEVDNSPKMTLIDTGASAYVIVKGAAASPSENTAALKLRAYLQQISGVELPIVTDAAPAAEKEIIVGRTNREGAGYTVDRAALGDEGFIIKTVGAKLVIAGGEKRGTLYGVFDFLEKFLDCAWLSADTTIVPEKATVCIPAAIDEYETPAFMF